MAKIDAFFNLMFEQKASDLHCRRATTRCCASTASCIAWTIRPWTTNSLKKMLYEIAPEYKIKVFEETGDVDFGYEIPNISRFRANFFQQKIGVAAVFRQIPSKVLSFEDFEKVRRAPAPGAEKICMLHKGWWWSPARPARASPPPWPR
jgi:twitching motility protein PilT